MDKQYSCANCIHHEYIFVETGFWKWHPHCRLEMMDIDNPTTTTCSKMERKDKMKNKKPTVFSYGDYVKAEKKIEELKAANKVLKAQILDKDIHIKHLEEQLKELRDNGPTVTGLIEVIRNKACDTCVKNTQCEEALANGEDFECFLDIL